MKNWTINSDMGEGIGTDDLLMPYVDLCSIACGGHTGDEKSMQSTILLAKKHRVLIGAHPSYPDLKNFGRAHVEIEEEALLSSLQVQVESLRKICLKNQTDISHIKPHGALYNEACNDKSTAMLIICLMQNYEGIPLVAPWQSAMSENALENNIPVIFEAFADRRYHQDLSLVSRSNADAVISDPTKAREQVCQILFKQRLETMEGEMVVFNADTFCIHGDNPAALEIAKSLNQLK